MRGQYCPLHCDRLMLRCQGRPSCLPFPVWVAVLLWFGGGWGLVWCGLPLPSPFLPWPAPNSFSALILEPLGSVDQLVPRAPLPGRGVRMRGDRGLWFLLLLWAVGALWLLWGWVGGLVCFVVCYLGHPPCAWCFWCAAKNGQTGAPSLASRKPMACLVWWLGVGFGLLLAVWPPVLCCRFGASMTFRPRLSCCRYVSSFWTC